MNAQLVNLDFTLYPWADWDEWAVFKLSLFEKPDDYLTVIFALQIGKFYVAVTHTKP